MHISLYTQSFSIVVSSFVRTQQGNSIFVYSSYHLAWTRQLLIYFYILPAFDISKVISHFFTAVFQMQTVLNFSSCIHLTDLEQMYGIGQMTAAAVKLL